jgi:hypothetical protein
MTLDVRIHKSVAGQMQLLRMTDEDSFVRNIGGELQREICDMIDSTYRINEREECCES